MDASPAEERNRRETEVSSAAIRFGAASFFVVRFFVRITWTFASGRFFQKLFGGFDPATLRRIFGVRRTRDCFERLKIFRPDQANARFLFALL